MVLKFDQAFVQAVEHRPKTAISEVGGIPVIDLAALDGGFQPPEAPKLLVAEIGAAAKDWGFFQVINHGVPAKLLEGIQSAAKGFFALPLEEKRRVKRGEGNPLGYYETEHTKNVRDWKEVFDLFVNETAENSATADSGEERTDAIRNRWPDYPPEFRSACEEYAKGLEKLAYQLLELLSLSLGLPANCLNKFFNDHTTRIRLNHYPPCPKPQLALGVGRHKDGGALTILAQDDVGGLDVRRKRDGEWVRVKPIPNSFIVNVGDIVQVWSNDEYESVEHRVSVNSERERFSIPFFFNPAFETNVRPLEELTSDENPAKYEEYNWGHFFRARRASNFKKMEKENLQIYHFRKAL
ncbi:Naringenin,2-oxoglutarate 3-dioxygenase [Apostasia shenzhenica]|uniref:Naringenin,2-oxoglutarate 3-dioxygenase n=1 Tax=Apostasia shenzhenica TaxID=1088818 RepID=A0A2I0AFP3_9ASPA|nr:Naringenin,2-oxoglutarate 3-dioxygenase [Apostasia shenzhenica]